MNTVNPELQNINIEEPEDNFEKVLLRSVLTPSQVSEVEARQKQPVSVMTQLYGNATGFHMLDDRVHPKTMAMLDESNKMILLSPVVGGC